MTEVIFYWEKDKSNVFAYFPRITEGPNGERLCYAHVGQHGQCSAEYAAQCLEAKPSEYKELLFELGIVGYENLIILNE